MEAASPARLYASAAGALLIVLGLLGFFYSADFGAPGTQGEMLGAFRVNAWVNLLHAAIGALGLLAAGRAARPFALLCGWFFVALAVWGFALGAGEAVLGFIPAGTGENWLHLGLGLLGLAAAAATPRRGPSEARADAAGERA